MVVTADRKDVGKFSTRAHEGFFVRVRPRAGAQGGDEPAVLAAAVRAVAASRDLSCGNKVHAVPLCHMPFSVALNAIPLARSFTPKLISSK
jgi:hypothetical protein